MACSWGRRPPVVDTDHLRPGPPLLLAINYPSRRNEKGQLLGGTVRPKGTNVGGANPVSIIGARWALPPAPVGVSWVDRPVFRRGKLQGEFRDARATSRGVRSVSTQASPCGGLLSARRNSRRPMRLFPTSPYASGFLRAARGRLLRKLGLFETRMRYTELYHPCDGI